MAILLGTDLKDSLTGGKESDILYGDNSNDIIEGLAGDDILAGGAGNDTLTGGAGTDYFIFSPSEGIDTISDFSQQDQIVIDERAFNATSTDQFRYDNATGQLFFDASPSDNIAGVPFASLPPNLGIAFNPKQNIALPLADSNIVASPGGGDSINNSFNNDFSNIDTGGKPFFADPLIV